MGSPLRPDETMHPNDYTGIVHIGLGSNIDPRHRYLARAVRRLAELGSLRSVSTIYETEPLYRTDQGPFLNAVAAVHFESLSPHRLLDMLAAIETSLGRVRNDRWGPRTVDLDILLVGDIVVNTDRLTVPHLRLAERRFVLRPLAEIAPELLHPVSHLPIRRLLLDAPPALVYPHSCTIRP